MKMLNLLGDDGCIERGIFPISANGDRYAVFRCRYCQVLLPEAGLGVAFWTRKVLLNHLANCVKATQEVRDEALLESRPVVATECKARSEPYASLDGRIFVHIDDPRAVCPICGAMFKWSCISDPHESSGGMAHCQDGRMVSRRMDKDGRMHMLNDRTHPSCRWAGTRTYRLPDNEVYVRWPFHLTLLPEAIPGETP